MPLEHRPGSLQLTYESGWPPYTSPPAQNVDATISDDRTRNSAFETSGQQWVALKPRENVKQIDNREGLDKETKRNLNPGSYPVQWPRPSMSHEYYLPSHTSIQNPFSPIDTKIPVTGSSSFRIPHRTRTQAKETGYNVQPSQSDAQWQEVLPQQSMDTIAKLLGIPDDAAMSLDTMRAYISNTHNVSTPPKDVEPILLEVHCVFEGRPPRGDSSIYEDAHGQGERQATQTDSPERCRMYLDQPRWRSGAIKRQKTLIGDLPIDSLERYLLRHSDVSFVVVKQYDSSIQKPVAEAYNIAARADHISESIIPITRSLKRLIIAFVASIGVSYIPSPRDGNRTHHIDTLLRHADDVYDRDMDLGSESGLSNASSGILPSRPAYFEDMAGAQTLTSPYLPIYHARGLTLDTYMQTLHGKEHTEFQLMLNCILSHYEEEHAVVDALLAEGNIYKEYVEYLFRPGMIVVQGHGDDIKSYKCVSGLTSTDAPLPTSHHQNTLYHDEDDARDLVSNDSEPQFQREEAGQLCILVWQWKLRNGFKKTKLKRLVVDLSHTDRSKQKISSLGVRPLRFVTKTESERLKNRGQWFWRCRKKQMVSYMSDTDQKSHFANDRRYMIDMQVYQELHGIKKRANNTARPTWMDAENPPDEDFVYLSPSTIKGYNLKTKKWQDLYIDGLSEVTWNTAAFDSLVLNGKTKRLIQALISNQIETEMSTDIIAGKGNGLIMLLHGGPGTGKTLTAESVAEIAQRPLYPVTCGDIGTEPAAVERYLESVLHLGKTWGCVVLLDEADVFLEQRSLEDLHRNALVSVFLRVLEYYDGILVLTSNRVGTFDEAFRSRIQLAIHYTSLTTHQRTRIWENFFKRLEQLAEDGIDIVDLKDNVDKLAKHNMNGREIRNVITTARQFARWERKQAAGEKYKLDYKVMEEVIETSGEFDKYIAKLNRGFTQDQLAEDEGLRLANNVE